MEKRNKMEPNVIFIHLGIFLDSKLADQAMSIDRVCCSDIHTFINSPREHTPSEKNKRCINKQAIISRRFIKF